LPLVMIKSDRRAREKPCLRCGYSLRGLLDAKNCPECGLPVWISLNGNDSLEWSNPLWLRRIVPGAYLLWIGMLLTLVFPLLFLGPRIPSAILVVSGILLINCGLLLLSWPEGRFPDRVGPLRWLLRVIGVMGIMAAMAVCLRLTRNGANSVMMPEIQRWAASIHMLTIAAGLASWPLMRHLTKRNGSLGLARFCGYLAVAWLIYLIAQVPSGALLLAWAHRSGPPILWALLLVSTIVLGLSLPALRRSARLAQANWNTPA
jgi:hypothetical protein